MKALKLLVMVVCVWALMACLSPAALQAESVVVSVIQVSDPGYAVPSLWVCEWMKLSTQDCDTSWIVHADEDIFDLHFGTWDDDEMVTPGQTPFGQWSNACTLEDTGGPPGGPQKQYWQTLDLWDGAMPYCSYWEIQINHKPQLDGVIQDVWVHPTPEPATIALLGLGGLALMRRRKR